MKTKFFTKNENGKVEFTEKELKTLLDEIYNEGYNDGRSRSYIYTTPYYPWYKTYCTTNSTDSKTITTATVSDFITIKGDK